MTTALLITANVNVIMLFWIARLENKIQELSIKQEENSNKLRYCVSRIEMLTTALDLLFASYFREKNQDNQEVIQ